MREGLTRVGVYERSLPVSGERVWENVHDWEHLPWLHAGSFAAIDLVDSGDWGWRAHIGLHGGGRILLELVIEDDAPRYVSRTVEGPGAGSEIWTDVDARGDDETAVRVEFWLPGVAAEAADALGAMYVKLYTQLWDEDESMMTDRARELSAKRSASETPRASAPATVSLGRLSDLRPQLPLSVRFGGRGFRVVEHDGRLVAYSAVCPHLLGPLGDAPVEEGRVVCPWHGYTFDIETGRECSGRRLKLPPPPRVLVDPENEQVYLDAKLDAKFGG